MAALRKACGAAAAMLALACAPCRAGEEAATHANAPAAWVAVGPAVLDETRGGFTLFAGLEVSLGIEREVLINGAIVSRTSLQLTDLSRMSAEQARKASQALSAVTLIQNGQGNVYVPAMAPETMGGTVIQNTLNDQLIRTSTVIHSSVNSMGLLMTMNFQDSLGNALLRAVGPH